MKLVALVLLFISVCYCQVDFNERPRNFSIELLYYTRLCVCSSRSETDGHFVISPFSIWTLMTGIALGATGNSYDQLARALILPKYSLKTTLVRGYRGLTNAILDQGDNGIRLVSRNFVFLDNDFSVYPEFRSTLQNDFSASLKVLDFDDPNSARIANTYIERSGGRVSNVLRSDDFRESRMILTNVISFKGLWASPFNRSYTALEPFYDEDKNVTGYVNMMFQKGQFAFSHVQAFKSFVVELPYGKNGKYSMIVMLPYPEARIAEIFKSFSHGSFKNIFERLQDDIDSFGLADIAVKLPRFHISTNLVLNNPLNDMGVYDIFQPDLASFQRVSKDSIFVSAAVHKADIEVTEEGIVTSTATTATFSDTESAPSLIANRPFSYFIMEKTTKTVLFSGIYSKPTVL